MTKVINLTTDDLFVAFSLPGATNYNIYRQTDGHPLDINWNEEGFVIAPFMEEINSPKLMIRPDESYQNVDFHFETREKIQSQDITKAQYLTKLATLKAKLNRLGHSKVIISRTNFITKADNNLASLFKKLTAEHPTAFVFLFNIPGVGSWMGASPELLIEQRDSTYQSIALAGTRRLSKDTNLVWSEKDQLEHQLVADFFQEKLSSLSIVPAISGPQSVMAANVQHLMTRFNYHYDGAFEQLIERLHPSPALLGWPVEEATELVRQIEGHNRGYYCGYLGPIRADQKVLFVNLRSMRCGANGFVLYAGGGILSNSSPEAEWQETESKLNLMRNAILNA